MPNRPQTRISLLDAVPELGTDLDADAFSEARESLMVARARIPSGRWSPPETVPSPGHLGYMLVSGALIRSVQVAGGCSVELLGAGDLIRPWQEDAASFADGSWMVLEDATLVALDQKLALRLARWPAIVAAVVEQALSRSRALAISAAIESITGMERRLLVLFWFLAERWGRRDGDAIRLSVGLTHQTIADLVGARRPSVTTTLAQLNDAGTLRRTSDGTWLLQGDPP